MRRQLRHLCATLAIACLVAGPALGADPIQPDPTKTPGQVDPAVTDADICQKVWQEGDPPTHGGTQTYSQAGRQTSTAEKEQSFTRYGITNPHDGGMSYEVDHRVPLSLGGRDVIENLWPESRTATEYSAWIKDRLENRLYNLVCHPKAGAMRLPLKDAQDAFLGDWTVAYKAYCPTWKAC